MKIQSIFNWTFGGILIIFGFLVFLTLALGFSITTLFLGIISTSCGYWFMEKEYSAIKEKREIRNAKIKEFFRPIQEIEGR